MNSGAIGRPAAPILYYQGTGIATQQPGTKLTVISGALRGRRCIHEEDVVDKTVDSPVPVTAFRVRLLTGYGEVGRSVVVGCHSVMVGW